MKNEMIVGQVKQNALFQSREMSKNKEKTRTELNKNRAEKEYHVSLL